MSIHHRDHKSGRGRPRTGFLAVAISMLLLLVLSACGGGDEDGAAEDAGGAATEDAEEPVATEPATTEGADTGTEAAGAEEGALVLEDEVVADPELYAAAQEEGGLVFYTAMLEETELALTELFEEDTGLSVEFVRNPTNRLYERIITEHGADAFPADVVRMPDVTFLNDLVERGVFTEHEVAAGDAIPEEFVHEGGLYYSTAIGPTSMGVNTEFLPTEEPPSTYEDLLDPAYQGEIGMAHVGVGTTAWIFAQMTRQEFGVEYWEELAAQDVTLTAGNAQAADLLARGEVSVAYLRPNAILVLQEQGAPVEVVWAEDHMPIFSFYMGLVDGGENPNAAKVFMNWHLSKRGQTATADVSGEYSVRPDVDPPTLSGVTFPPLSEQPIYQPDPEIWATEREAWTEEWFEIFGFQP